MKITLKNIGKITDAEIQLDAFTIIAGENNTGKSTVGRALYLYIDSLRNIDEYVQNDLIITLNRNLVGVMDEFDLICRNFAHASRRHKISKANELRLAYAQDMILDGEDIKKERTQQLIKQYAALYGITAIDELMNFNQKQSAVWKHHLDDVLQNTLHQDILELENRKITTAISTYFDENIISFGHETEGAFIRVDNDGYQNKLYFSRNKKAGQDFCSKIEREGNIIQSALYIDSPKIVDDLYSLSRITNFDATEEIPLLLSPARIKNPSQFNVSTESETSSETNQREKILGEFENEITKIAGGRLDFDQATGLEFKETGEKRAVKIANLSNGIKAITLLEYAIRNGALHKGDFLILDEPEINLHPAWQMKYAELLVHISQN